MRQPSAFDRSRRAVALAVILGAGCAGNVEVAPAPESRSGVSSSDAGPGSLPPSDAPTPASDAAVPDASSRQREPAAPPAAESEAELEAVPEAVAVSSCDALGREVESTLTQSCASCHADGKREGGFDVVLDVPAMIAQGKLVPRDRAGSKLYMYVSSGLMPRGSSKLAQPKIEALGQWIDCGAPDFRAPIAADSAIGFLDIDARLRNLREDLSARGSDDARRRTRYIDLSGLSNAGASRERVVVYRNAIAFLLNSLSFERTIALPAQVGRDGLLVRIDLDDYGWDAGNWERIVQDYPYAVRYTGRARRFQFDEDAGSALREQTGTEIPVVQADWFLAHVSRPPLYYDVLGIAQSINDLTDALGVDVAGNVDEARVARAGFNRSGISANNRVMERHDKPDGSGAFWLSYDFRANVGVQNIFAHPFDFEQAGGEGIFHLPNGLQGYFLLDGAFNRLDKAPTDIVTDPNTKDRAVEGGRSCMGGCHLNRGILFKDDEVRDYVLNTPEAEPLRARTLELYAERAQMRRLIEGDNKRYLAALEKTGFLSTDENALNDLIRAHEDLIDADGVAAVLGIRGADFAAALDANADELPLEISALRQPGGTIYRDVLDNRFGEIAAALGLGEAIE